MFLVVNYYAIAENLTPFAWIVLCPKSYCCL